jgi:hypothetical protein
MSIRFGLKTLCVIPYPARGYCRQYSVVPSRNTILTYETLPPVTQIDTMHKDWSHPSEVSQQIERKNTLLSKPFMSLTYMVT